MSDHDTATQLRRLNKSFEQLASAHRKTSPKDSPSSPFRKYSLCLPNRPPYASHDQINEVHIRQQFPGLNPTIFIPASAPHLILLVFDSIEEAKRVQSQSSLLLRRYAGPRNLGGWARQERLDMIFYHRVPISFYQHSQTRRLEILKEALTHLPSPANLIALFVLLLNPPVQLVLR
jgi:hypothetical protein